MPQSFTQRHLAIFASIIVIASCIAGLAIASPDASTIFRSDSSAQATVRNIYFDPLHSSDSLVPSINIVDSSSDQLIVEFTLPGLKIAELEVDRESYHLISIDGGDHSGQPGDPMLPQFSRLVQIPESTIATLRVVDVATETITDLRPVPLQPNEGAEFVINADAYLASSSINPDFYSDQIATSGEPAIARGQRVVPISISPVVFDPATNEVHVAKRLRIEINFSVAEEVGGPVRRDIPLTPSFRKLYQNLIINYDHSRSSQPTSLGTYLIICPDDPEVLSALEPLVEWRTRKGFDVHLATLTETGSTSGAIISWLQQIYLDWDNPPEYISLIGDTSGTIAVPTCYETFSGWSGEGDHPYVCLDGDDSLADAHIGRISVGTVNQLILYVNKIVGYESEPYLEETDWYTRACLVGDPTSSGFTCIQAMQWLSERLLERNYTELDTIYQAPFATEMTTSLNRGDTVFSYRGFYHMSEFGTSDILNLENGHKMPFAVNLTCDTGSFAHGTSRSEAWIRAGLPPDIPTGGIASIGTATIHTHTRYNNCTTYGIWRAPFWEDLYQFGALLTRGKYELFINYQERDPWNMAIFQHWNNLIGDSAGELWTAVPQAIDVTHPSSLPLGANSLPLTVTAAGAPLTDAYVCLWPNGQTPLGSYTDENGHVDIAFTGSHSDSLKITVTKHDHHPYLSTIGYGASERYAGYQAHTIDDDNSGASLGNSDGLINPNETIELSCSVRNFDSAEMIDVTGLITSSDPYLIIINDQTSFATIDPGATAWSQSDFIFSITPDAPDGHEFQLSLDLSSGAESWHGTVPLTVHSADLVFEELVPYGFGDHIDRGEEGELEILLHNQGSEAATGLSAVLRSDTSCFEVIDSIATYGTIAPGGFGINQFDRFYIKAHLECINGQLIPLSLDLTFADGAIGTVHFVATVGAITPIDPTGPDRYGYYAFDNNDTYYTDAPVYDWVELSPNYGGNGISVGLSDFGTAQDDSKTVTLPFPFKYYGTWFSELTICSNGWLAMGHTNLTNYRNWNIPCAGAPANLIAPHWDNLVQEGSNRVYHLYDEVNHRYIIQWSRLKHIGTGFTSNFEVILLDPNFHHSDTGDGVIIFQYDEYSSPDGLQHYSTTGIQNSFRDDGLMYTYYNYYNSGASPIASGSAIKFMTYAHGDRGTLAGLTTNQSTGDLPLAGVTVSVLERGVSFNSDYNGQYGGSVSTGTYSIAAYHPSFAPDTVSAVEIELNETSNIDFSLIDIAPPIFHNTTDYPSTIDVDGPYTITTTIEEYSNLIEHSLWYNIAGTGWVELQMTQLEGDQFTADIPGADYTSLIHYYISGADNAGNYATDPANPPADVYDFWVQPPQFADDCESGEGVWAHHAVTDTFVDQWHHTDEDNHTAGGAYCWKFGGVLAPYENFADGALVTEQFFTEGAATLTFWHSISAEESAQYPGYAYDGGIIELSIDGGEWTQIASTTGYNRITRVRALGPGPFPWYIPIYSGVIPWSKEEVHLNEPGHMLQIRFRFGSDFAIVDDGWFIDDVMVIGDSPGLAGIDDDPPQPKQLLLYQNSPNPFRGIDTGTLLNFDLPAPAAARLQIIDLAGRQVKLLVDGKLPAGNHQIFWDGRDEHSNPVNSGVYFYVLDTNNRRESKQLLILK